MKIEILNQRGLLLLQIVSRMFERRFEKYEQFSYFYEWLERFNGGSAISHSDNQTKEVIEKLLNEAGVTERDLTGSIKLGEEE